MTFPQIILFLSNNFERILLTNIFILTLITAGLLFQILFEFRYSFSFRSVFRKTVITGFFVLYSLSLILTGFIFYRNYVDPRDRVRYAEPMADVSTFVTDTTRLYFVQGSRLKSITAGGGPENILFDAGEGIKEYIFSPDGRFILVLTQNTVYLVKRKGPEPAVEILDVGELNARDGIHASYSGVRWAPDSRKFTYEINRWSSVVSQNNLYVYHISESRAEAVKSPAKRISSVYWGSEGENLYYLYHEALDTQRRGHAFDVKVYRIPLKTMRPELMATIPYEDSDLPLAGLYLRDVEIFQAGDNNRFGSPPGRFRLVADTGSSAGIDDKDYIYVIPHAWFKKRLFKVPRVPDGTESLRHQYRGGELSVQAIRWLPGGRYLLIEDEKMGAMILDPFREKIGFLAPAGARHFGWPSSNPA